MVKAERRKKRKRFALVSAFVMLLSIMAAIGTFWRQAERSRQVAEAETRRAEASKLIALGQLELDEYPTAAVAYSIASLELADTPVGPTLRAWKPSGRGPRRSSCQIPKIPEAEVDS